MTNSDTILQALEALLFAAGEPVSRAHLCTVLNVSDTTLGNYAADLSTRYQGGIQLLVTERHLALTSAPTQSALIEEALGERKETPIGDAGLEVLAILLYEGPSTKAHIDYVRGVNSSSSLRLLLSRGLILRHKGESNEMRYEASPDTLAHLGLGRIEEVPQRAEVREKLSAFVAKLQEQTS